MSKFVDRRSVVILSLVNEILDYDNELKLYKEYIIKPCLKLQTEEFYKILISLNHRCDFFNIKYKTRLLNALKSGDKEDIVSKILDFSGVEDITEEMIKLNHVVEKCVINDKYDIIKIYFDK